jgi:hypothetical protein
MRCSLFVLLIPLAGCGGVLKWGTVSSAASPDRKIRVRVQEKGCFADCAVRIIVKSGWHEEEIASGSDCVINFAHAEWSGSIVAAFVDGFYCGQLKVAYDTTLKRGVDLRLVEPWLKPAIIKAYAVTPEELQPATETFWCGQHILGTVILAAARMNFTDASLGLDFRCGKKRERAPQFESEL